MDAIFVIIGLLLAAFWLIPAAILTVKVQRHEFIPPELKSQLIKPIWFAPIIGNIICYFFFAKTGKLNKLSKSEHRSIWAGYTRR